MDWIRTADAIIARSPVSDVAERLGRRRLAVLAYHKIDEPSMFKQHLEYIERHLCAVSLDDVVRARTGAELPPRSVLITFDDGDRSVLDVALPLLVARGLPAVAFVVPGLLDSERPHWWVEVDALVRAGASAPGGGGRAPDDVVRRMKVLPDGRREAELKQLRGGVSEPVRQRQLRRSELTQLEACGIEVGNHTLTHRYLSRCSDRVVEVEVRQAHRVLEDTLGHAPRAFAYPDRDRDPRALPVMHQLEYQAAFLFNHRLNRLPLADPFAISRVRVSSLTSINRFRTIVNGVHPAVHGIRSRIMGRDP